MLMPMRMDTGMQIVLHRHVPSLTDMFQTAPIVTMIPPQAGPSIQAQQKPAAMEQMIIATDKWMKTVQYTLTTLMPMETRMEILQSQFLLQAILRQQVMFQTIRIVTMLPPQAGQYI